MLQKLYDLVFGLDEFEKTKIDLRFDLIEEILPKIHINTIQDFDLLESCIFKIKDQLRIRSSNLNRIINDPKKNLTKTKVENYLNILSSLRKSFLHEAFDAIRPEIQNIEASQEPIIQEKEELNQESKKETSKRELEIISNANYAVKLKNASPQYLEVTFSKEIDLNLLKTLSSIVFEVFKAQGTNIIIENNIGRIYPRFQSDNLFTLPTIDVDLDEIERKLKKEEKQTKEESIDYYPVEEKQEIKTHKKQEDSLDELISGIEKKNHTPTHKPEEIKEDINIIKTEPIEIEKDNVKKNEIEIEKQEETISKEINQNFEIYRDEHIRAFLRKTSKAKGELLVETIQKKPLGALSEQELSYITIFTKIFSSVVFETLNAKGTNVIWDMLDSQIHIIPRDDNDSLGLSWNPKKDSDEFLEQVRSKLIAKMQGELQDEISLKEIKQEAKMPSKDASPKEKADFILDALKRIP